MKARLEFNLSDEDDKENYRIMRQSVDMYCSLIEFSDVLRKIRKYGTLEDFPEHKMTKEDVEFTEKLETMFWKILNERNVKID
jgi:hypothetical protein